MLRLHDQRWKELRRAKPDRDYLSGSECQTGPISWPSNSLWVTPAAPTQQRELPSVNERLTDSALISGNEAVGGSGPDGE
jgi:hypothetical protein